MSASLALAGVSACTRQPNEELVPYVRQPEELVPGKPLFYATAMPFAGSGVGLLVESHEGRPTKIEGNPDHPSSRGATDLFAQAAILGLYDPGSLDHDHQPRRDPSVQRVLRGAARRPRARSRPRRAPACASSPRPWRRRRSAAQIEEILTRAARGEVGAVGAGRPPQRPRRQPPRVRRVRRRAVRARQGRRHPVARRRLHVHRRGGPAARARVCLAAPRRERPARATGSTRSRARRPISGTRADHRLPLKASEIEALRARRGRAARRGRRRGRPLSRSRHARGWRRSWRTCRPRAAAASSSRVTARRRRCTRWRTR